MSLPKTLQNLINNSGYGTNLTGNDNDIVHKTGDEFIEGIKEFSNFYHDSTREGETDFESSSLIIRHHNYEKASVPSTNT